MLQSLDDLNVESARVMVSGNVDLFDFDVKNFQNCLGLNFIVLARFLIYNHAVWFLSCV
jgi:hypothetical protein